jgi:hypothetical protein
MTRAIDAVARRQMNNRNWLRDNMVFPCLCPANNQAKFGTVRAAVSRLSRTCLRQRAGDGFSRLFRSLFGAGFTVESPFQWKTRADVPTPSG